MTKAHQIQIELSEADNPKRDKEEVEGFEGVDDGLLPSPEDREPPVDPDTKKIKYLYQKKKTAAEGLLDIALLTANVNQLRYILDMGPNHRYYTINVALLGTSLSLQALVALLLIWNSTNDVKRGTESVIKRARAINMFILLAIVIITFLNVFISVLCVPGDGYALPPIKIQDGTNDTELLP